MTKHEQEPAKARPYRLLLSTTQILKVQRDDLQRQRDDLLVALRQCCQLMDIHELEIPGFVLRTMSNAEGPAQ